MLELEQNAILLLLLYTRLLEYLSRAVVGHHLARSGPAAGSQILMMLVRAWSSLPLRTQGIGCAGKPAGTPRAPPAGRARPIRSSVRSSLPHRASSPIMLAHHMDTHGGRHDPCSCAVQVNTTVTLLWTGQSHADHASAMMASASASILIFCKNLTGLQLVTGSYSACQVRHHVNISQDHSYSEHVAT
jgi:hypothetical protein